jgi:hypothetical protein
MKEKGWGRRGYRGGDGRGTEIGEMIEEFEVVLSSTGAVEGMKRRSGGKE